MDQSHPLSHRAIIRVVLEDKHPDFLGVMFTLKQPLTLYRHGHMTFQIDSIAGILKRKDGPLQTSLAVGV